MDLQTSKPTLEVAWHKTKI